MWKSGHGRERGEQVGVKEKAAETRAAHNRREGGEGVAGKVDVF